MTPCYYCEADDDTCKTCIHSDTYIDPHEEITKLHKTIAAQAAVIESLKRAIGDWDRAETSSELQSAEAGLLKALAIPTDSTPILDEVRRAERERCAERAEAYAYMSQNFNALAEEIRAME